MISSSKHKQQPILCIGQQNINDHLSTSDASINTISSNKQTSQKQVTRWIRMYQQHLLNSDTIARSFYFAYASCSGTKKSYLDTDTYISTHEYTQLSSILAIVHQYAFFFHITACVALASVRLPHDTHWLVRTAPLLIDGTKKAAASWTGVKKVLTSASPYT